MGEAMTMTVTTSTMSFVADTVRSGEFSIYVFALLCIIFVLIIVSTAVGNLFVMLAIYCERELAKRPQNLLIFSLAAADFGVGIAVQPLSAYNDLNGNRWQLGEIVCDIWVFLDMLACTSSILHLVAISLDRYWSITDIRYTQKRTRQRICVMLVVVWSISLLVSIPPILGLKDANSHNRTVLELTCIPSQDVVYQTLSTTMAFYLPLIIMLGVYFGIYRAAKKRIRKRNSSMANPVQQPLLRVVPPSTTSNGYHCRPGAQATPSGIQPDAYSEMPTSTYPAQTTMSTGATKSASCGGIANLRDAANGKSWVSSHDLTTISNGIEDDLGSTMIIARSNTGENLRESTATLVLVNMAVGSVSNKSSPIVSLKRLVKKSSASVEAKRERKAFQTLAIITGTFVVCWLPFFIVALLRPLLDEPKFDPVMMTFFNWLGWGNSLVNPLIYTVFAPDFRNAFRKILVKLCSFSNCSRLSTRSHV